MYQEGIGRQRVFYWDEKNTRFRTKRHPSQNAERPTGTSLTLRLRGS